MKKILLLLLALMPFVLFSQSKSNDDGIKIAFDAEVNGCRVIATTEKAIVPFDNVLSVDGPLMVSLMYRCNEKQYSIRFSCANGEKSQLFLRAPQPILLTQKNGQVLTFKAVDDFGPVEIDNNSFKKYPIHSSNTQYFSFCVTREKINEIIQSGIIKVQLSPDGKGMRDFTIDDHLLSEVLNQQLNVIDKQIEHSMPVDHKVLLQSKP